MRPKWHMVRAVGGIVAVATGLAIAATVLVVRWPKPSLSEQAMAVARAIVELDGEKVYAHLLSDQVEAFDLERAEAGELLRKLYAPILRKCRAEVGPLAPGSPNQGLAQVRFRSRTDNWEGQITIVLNAVDGHGVLPVEDLVFAAWQVRYALRHRIGVHLVDLPYATLDGLLQQEALLRRSGVRGLWSVVEWRPIEWMRVREKLIADLAARAKGQGSFQPRGRSPVRGLLRVGEVRQLMSRFRRKFASDFARYDQTVETLERQTRAAMKAARFTDVDRLLETQVKLEGSLYPLVDRLSDEEYLQVRAHALRADPYLLKDDAVGDLLWLTPSQRNEIFIASANTRHLKGEDRARAFLQRAHEVLSPAQRTLYELAQRSSN